MSAPRVPAGPNSLAVCASRRGVLGVIALIPTVAAIPALGAVLPTQGGSPLMAAIAASNAADARFNALPEDLEQTNPTLHDVEEKRMLNAYRYACRQAPASWSEFVALLDLMTAGGAFGIEERNADAMLTHARRLDREGR